MPTPALLPPLWLRDNCGCAACRDPRNGQKLFQITDLPDGLAVAEASPAEVDGAPGWDVVWRPDGHRSRYTDAWLAADGAADAADATDSKAVDRRTEDGKELWHADDLAHRLPEAAWTAYLADPAEKIRVLAAVERIGFAVLRGVPVAGGQVTRVAESFGFVRETNYGRLFDVRVQQNPNNLAFTGERITPHTDNPYRDPVPTLQLLHCLVNEARGGDSGLVDGFAAAARLRRRDPAAFDALSRTPVPFSFADPTTRLSALRPLIGTDSRGRIREIRFNNRSIGTLRLPADRMTAFYTAYRTFAELLLRPGAQLDFRLAPGDCLIFDNTRLLHARTAFENGGGDGGDGDGGRHLQGCYADMDGLLSTLDVLRAEAAATRTESAAVHTVSVTARTESVATQTESVAALGGAA